MIFYGLASRFVGEVVEFFPSRTAAEAAVEGAAQDSPELAEDVYVAAIAFNVVSAPNEGRAWEWGTLIHRGRVGRSGGAAANSRSGSHDAGRFSG
jgi:hypothetical protein